MKAYCRDLGRMDYKTCWELQQGLFDALVARKAACKGATKQAAAIPAAYAGTAEADQASAREPAQRSAEAMPSKAGTQSGKGLESPTGSVSAAEGVEPSGATGEGSASAGTILLVEHPPVYTLGKSGHAENLLIGREALEAMGAQFFHIDRGGDITFHGPGQLVCYPILDLERIGIGLREYIEALEEAVIRTVAEYGIAAGRIAGASGVWIDPGKARPRKICAIGVRSSRYVTMHGFALNVTTDLEWFSRINPCGFTDRGVTSIAAETGSQPSMQEVKQLVIRELATALQCEITSGS